MTYKGQELLMSRAALPATHGAEAINRSPWAWVSEPEDPSHPFWCRDGSWFPTAWDTGETR